LKDLPKPSLEVKQRIIDFAILAVRLSPESLDKLIDHAQDLWLVEHGDKERRKQPRLNVIHMKRQGGGQ